MNNEVSKPRLKIKIEIDYVWITSYGLRIHVRSMSSEYMKHCINCLTSGVSEGGTRTMSSDYLGGKDKWLKIFNRELLKRQ